ncbi:MAG: gamma-glutamyl-gamma-aminobutyrate hydrolase family protein [Bacteroidales bacterium]|nr:gamma-glutamyl-gamma-aminobutyrate hydrolase family protein [Bacteroidales bacterium]
MKTRQFIILILALSVSFVAQARKKPLIGVAPGYSGSMTSTVSRSYTDAIFRAGGIPVILPQVDNPAAAAEMLSRLDGMVLTGGPDLNPAYYGESVLNGTVEIDAHRDTVDILYAKAALESKKPLLAICRGEQLLNVVLGGSLYQDLPSQKPGDIAHRQSIDSKIPTHSVSVVEGSALYRIMGRKSLDVNTLHHQAVKTPSDKVIVTAYSPDGVVEAYEGKDKGQWLLAVQFHPEVLVRANDDWLALFKAFVKACR